MYLRRLGCFILCLICSLQAEEYVLFSPEQILSYLLSYSDQEQEEIVKDLQVVRSVCKLKEASTQNRPVYLATAGNSNSRKSTILERFIKENPVYQTGVYLDPDERALKFMVHTYYAQSLNALQTASSPYYLNVQQAAYEKWRAASRYITFSLLEEALQKKTTIIHGTTLTEAYVPEFLQKLKAEGYHITLVLCYSEDDLRTEAVQYKQDEQKSYPSPLGDAKIFPEKMSTYFQYADTLYLYWSDDLLSEERLAAIFDKGEMILREGCACALNHFMSKYEEDRDALILEGKTLPTWEELMQIYLKKSK